MIEHRTELDQIEVAQNGRVQLRFALKLVDGDSVLDSKWHRTAIEPGGNIDAQIEAVNAHLARMGRAAVADADVDRVKAHAAVAWGDK